MEKATFTPGEDFDKEIQEFEQWLDGKRKEPKLEKTNEELYACSWEDLVLHVKQLYAVIEEQRQTIQDWRNDFQ